MADPRLLFVLVAMMVAGLAPAQACSTARLDRLLAAPLPAKASRELDVGTPQSGEGGAWRIYGGVASRQIVRTDYGETGRTTLRLAIVKPGTYGLVRAMTRYTKSIGVPGNRERGTTTTTYRFCDGSLVRPSGQDDAAFAAHRAAASREKAEFEAEEIRAYAKAAGF